MSIISGASVNHVYVFDYKRNRFFHKAVVDQGHSINIPNYIEKLLCHDSFDYFVSSKPLELEELNNGFKNAPKPKDEFYV